MIKDNSLTDLSPKINRTQRSDLPTTVTWTNFTWVISAIILTTTKHFGEFLQLISCCDKNNFRERHIFPKFYSPIKAVRMRISPISSHLSKSQTYHFHILLFWQTRWHLLIAVEDSGHVLVWFDSFFSLSLWVCCTVEHGKLLKYSLSLMYVSDPIS